MARDPAKHRDELMNQVTILQLQTELLQRQLPRHDGMSAADREWLEQALATIVCTTREMSALLMEDAAPP